jgi:hypothetical protein
MLSSAHRSPYLHLSLQSSDLVTQGLHLGTDRGRLFLQGLFKTEHFFGQFCDLEGGHC